jgi:hypothetical protein
MLGATKYGPEKVKARTTTTLALTLQSGRRTATQQLLRLGRGTLLVGLDFSFA